jgi:ribosome recycling factor
VEVYSTCFFYSGIVKFACKQIEKTMEDLDLAQDLTKESMLKAFDHLNYELTKVRTGKASAVMLNDLKVDYYGSPTPLNQVANISNSDSRTLVIQPWEKKMLSAIEKSIFEANLGVTPMNDGEVIRLNIPPLTEERRKDLVKQAKHYGEEAKVSVRNARRDLMEEIKKAIKDGFPEDEGKRRETMAQQMTDDFIEKVEKLVQSKEEDIMTI